MPGYEGEADCSMCSAEKCQVSQEQFLHLIPAFLLYNIIIIIAQNNIGIGQNFHDAVPFPLFLQYLQFVAFIFLKFHYGLFHFL